MNIRRRLHVEKHKAIEAALYSDYVYGEYMKGLENGEDLDQKYIDKLREKTDYYNILADALVYLSTPVSYNTDIETVANMLDYQIDEVENEKVKNKLKKLKEKILTKDKAYER